MDFAGKDKATYVRDMFNTIAGRYDLMNTLMSLGMDRRWRQVAVRFSGAKPGDKMLDVCCGTGQLSYELAKTVGPKGQVTGVDFSEKMLAEAKVLVKDKPLAQNIKLLQGDAMALPFADNSFDGATVGWGLRNLPDLMKGIQEMTRVVKPGSWVVSLDMAKPSTPVFKETYWLYFEKLVPAMGKLWAGKKSAYSYLHDSARTFPAQDRLARIFKECGLTETGYRSLAGGVVAVVYGKKPAAKQGK
ncbi:MAG: bifunctional demethylmenaquinone methyltransferase/2-methoxy-6-polyprenyl-1,4-benzoquinol methylase UbiE [Desulfitobacteriaceae bacterium]